MPALLLLLAVVGRGAGGSGRDGAGDDTPDDVSSAVVMISSDRCCSLGESGGADAGEEPPLVVDCVLVGETGPSGPDAAPPDGTGEHGDSGAMCSVVGRNSADGAHGRCIFRRGSVRHPTATDAFASAASASASSAASDLWSSGAIS